MCVASIFFLFELCVFYFIWYDVVRFVFVFFFFCSSVGIFTVAILFVSVCVRSPSPVSVCVSPYLFGCEEDEGVEEQGEEHKGWIGGWLICSVCNLLSTVGETDKIVVRPMHNSLFVECVIVVSFLVRL